MASIEQIAADIKKTWERVGGRDWAKMTVIAANMSLDVSVDEFARAVRHLLNEDMDALAMPEMNQKTLTGMDRLYRIGWNGESNDLIRF